MEILTDWLARELIHCGYAPDNPFAPHGFGACLHWRWVHEPWLHIPVWILAHMAGAWLALRAVTYWRGRQQGPRGSTVLPLRREVSRHE